MKILLYGPRGQIGQELISHQPEAVDLIASSSNITQYDLIEKEIADLRPDVIINAAAYTQVDDAENNCPLAFQVNAFAPARLAEICQAQNILLVHYSTDYVYDGSGHTPWTETDIPCPLNVYGDSKLEGDVNITNSGCRHLILRTSWVHSPRGKNFIRTILKLARQRDALSVVEDQIGVPTSASLLAQITYTMIGKAIAQPALCGVYHVCPGGETSWYHYARIILRDLMPEGRCQITPIPSSQYPQAARRPLNSRLDTTKLSQNFGIHLPDWKEDLKTTFDVIRNED